MGCGGLRRGKAGRERPRYSLPVPVAILAATSSTPARDAGDSGGSVRGASWVRWAGPIAPLRGPPSSLLFHTDWSGDGPAAGAPGERRLQLEPRSREGTGDGPRTPQLRTPWRLVTRTYIRRRGRAEAGGRPPGRLRPPASPRPRNPADWRLQTARSDWRDGLSAPFKTVREGQSCAAWAESGRGLGSAAGVGVLHRGRSEAGRVLVCGVCALVPSCPASLRLPVDAG